MTREKYSRPATGGACLQAFDRQPPCAAALVALLFLALFFSSCSNGSGSGPDAGTDTGTGTGGDTDADSDSDTDTDTDTDTDMDTDGFVADAGPWDWTELPDAGDCGAIGCRQLTFTNEVRVLEWDVWGNLLSYSDGDIDNSSVHVVNISEAKQLTIPSPYTTDTTTFVFYPGTINENTVCYAKTANHWDGRSDLICADLESETQQLIYHRAKEGNEYPNPAKYIDIYGDRIISKGGCGEVMDSWPLCVFDIESPGIYEEITPDGYGGHNSMWGDVVVWTLAYTDNDIRGYDFSTQQFIEVTDDDNTEHQLAARIHEDRVVYMDMRFGDSDPMGDWNHSAIFMYEISTGTTTQITSGAWIASYPDVHDNIIVWADYRDSANPNNNTSFAGVQIWGYNIDTSTEFQITNILNRPKTMPRIWGDKVFVDMAKTTGGNAIYMFDLP